MSKPVDDGLDFVKDALLGLRKKLSDMDNQLKSARYYVHKVRHAYYLEQVERGEMMPDEAREKYLFAMSNYDDVISSAERGAFNEAMDREMADFNVNEAFGD